MANSKSCAFKITDQQAKDYMSLDKIGGAFAYAEKLARDEGIKGIKTALLIDCGHFYRLAVTY